MTGEVISRRVEREAMDGRMDNLVYTRSLSENQQLKRDFVSGYQDALIACRRPNMAAWDRL
jgi:hypothetical protein